MKKFVFLLAIFCCCAHAEEVYKWTDENGKVHFGDRSAAPQAGKKIDVKVVPPSGPAPSYGDKNMPPIPNIPTAPSMPPMPQMPTMPPMPSGPKMPPMPPMPPMPKAPMNMDAKSIPVDAAKVGPKCQGLADEIAKVKKGTPWQELARDFNTYCPGIAYECVTYKRQPEKNKCTWIERNDSNMLRTKTYE